MAQLWAFLAVGLPVLAAFIAGLSAVDLAYHLRAGAEFLDTGRISTTDTWTFTANGAPWLNQQWGAQAVLAVVFRVAGWTGLAIVRALLVGLTFGFVFEACRRRGLDLRRAAWLTLAAFVVGAVALALRPQLFGMALAALTLLLVADRRVHPGRVWAIPVIVAVWANVHGSFFLGPVILGLGWLEDIHDRVPPRHRLLAIAVVSAAAALVNPFFAGVWGYAAGLSTNAFVTSRITEWQPTTLRTIPGILFFASVGVVVIVLARRGRATSWPTLAWLAVFAAIGAFAIRGVAWWPLGAAVALAPLLVRGPGEAASRRPERASALHLLTAALIAIVCVVLLPIWRPSERGTEAPVGLLGDAPAGITQYLRDHAKPGERILNPQPWGSWFEFALPNNPVAIDSRIELFPAAVWATYEQIHTGADGWQQALRVWDVDFVAVDKDEAYFAARLQAAGWRSVYDSANGRVLRPDGMGE
jgi:hypothetical protein